MRSATLHRRMVSPCMGLGGRASWSYCDLQRDAFTYGKMLRGRVLPRLEGRPRRFTGNEWRERKLWRITNQRRHQTSLRLSA